MWSCKWLQQLLGHAQTTQDLTFLVDPGQFLFGREPRLDANGASQRFEIPTRRPNYSYRGHRACQDGQFRFAVSEPWGSQVRWRRQVSWISYIRDRASQKRSRRILRPRKIFEMSCLLQNRSRKIFLRRKIFFQTFPSSRCSIHFAYELLWDLRCSLRASQVRIDWSQRLDASLTSRRSHTSRDSVWLVESQWSSMEGLDPWSNTLHPGEWWFSCLCHRFSLSMRISMYI